MTPNMPLPQHTCLAQTQAEFGAPALASHSSPSPTLCLSVPACVLQVIFVSLWPPTHLGAPEGQVLAEGLAACDCFGKGLKSSTLDAMPFKGLTSFAVS